ncbi:hypothetical protein [Bacteroides gallinaceum]|uniref:hypothetical protein n=1 Tax=Bacteroides gallinaceum TaxID=1462571 RepID=UPI00195EB54A|nr:hypothetical protein [Bacteroides gallinaceum]MBM6660026.1 hypothetical protein [Bacteroides gallinaceum]
MAKLFRVRQVSYAWMFILLVLILVIVWLVWDSRNYWGLLGLLAPLGLAVDQLTTRIQIRDNGDVWIRRGFTGVSRLHGISKLIYRKQAWKSQQIVLRHTKGHATVDPKDRKGFIVSLKEANPMMEYVEE